MENYAQSLQEFQTKKDLNNEEEYFDHEFVPFNGNVELEVLKKEFMEVFY